MRAAAKPGTKATENARPTSSTMMPKRGADSGVPNSAEKNAAMPQAVAVRRSWSEKRKSFAML